MAITKQRISVTMSPEALALLERTGNRSGYLEAAVVERWRAWQEALAVLIKAGWGRATLRAAQDALAGYLIAALPPETLLARTLSLTLADAQRERDLCAKWKIERAHWESLRAGLEVHADLAHALLAVITELWSNEECVRRVTALDR